MHCLRRLVLLFLGINLCLCQGSALINYALANSPMPPKASDKVTGPTTPQLGDAPQPQVKYGRLPDRFIVNRGQPNELIRIYMEGEKPMISPSSAKVSQDNVPPKQTLHLRPFVKGEQHGKSDTDDEAPTGASSDEATVVGGYVATVTGPGEVSFLWKVSCEPFGAYMEATLDGKQVSEISGEVDWSSQNLTIPAGTHTLGWLYHKRDDSNIGADCGWLHEVEFTVTKTPEGQKFSESEEPDGRAL